MNPNSQEAIESGTEEGGAGNGEDPGEHNAAGDAPANGGEASRRANTHDGAGDRMRRADGNAEFRRAEQRQGPGGLRGKAAEGIELGDALSHGFDDAPAACHRAATHGQVAADDDPVGNFRGFQQAPSDERGGDDAHPLLRVIGAVAEAVTRGGDKLQAAEPAIHLERTLLADNPTGEHGDAYPYGHADDRSEKDENYRLNPAANDNGFESCVHNSSAPVPGD